MPSALRAHVLGGVRLQRDGERIDVPRARERQVLAVLIAAKGRSVSADRLVTEVWGEDAPDRALAALQVAVSRLRSLLEPDREPRAPARVLLSTAAGYRLELEPEAVDAWEFDALATSAVQQQAPAARLDLAERALALWDGDPYAGCDTDTTAHEADRLESRHLAVIEVAAEALLQLGRAEEAVDLTAPLLVEHRYLERLWALHALGHYRCARQGEALATLRQLRANLADDLGIDPTAEVTSLESAILNQDPSIDSPAPPESRLLAPVPAVATQAASAPETAGPVTVGREPSLRALRRLVDEAAASAGGFGVVSGEAGIGKSHLVEAFAAELEGRSVRAVMGRCHADFAPALWPWVPVVRSLWPSFPEPADEAALGPVLLDVPGELVDEQGAAFRLYDAVRRLLARAAEAGPLFVVIEDLQWADSTSLRLLRHLASAGLPSGVAVVVTLRADESPPTDDMVAALAALARAGATRVRLQGLARDEVATLLERHLGERLDGDDGRLAARVVDVTAGNPFFVHEYARLLATLPDLSAVSVGALPVPDGVRDVVRQRLSRLPDDARSLLAVGAVAGSALDPDLLAAVTGTDVVDVLDVLDLALASGLLESDGVGYAFGHTLVREALLADLSPARQVRLHGQLADELGRRPDPGPDLLTEVAYHARLAAPLGAEAATRAVDALVRAARAAGTRLAFDDALTLWDQAGELAAGSDLAVRVEILCGAAHALQRLARAPEARARLVTAVAIAAAEQRWELVPDAVAVLNRAGVWAWREHGVKDDAFVAALHAALDHVDDPGRARIMAALQVEHSFAWEGAVAGELGVRSLDLARATGSAPLLVEVLLANLVASSGPGKAPLRLERLEELAGLPLGEELAVFVDFLTAIALYECGRVDAADDAAQRCAGGAARLGHTGVEVPLAWFRFARARDAEDDEATRAAVDALRAHYERGELVGAGLDLFYRLRVQPGGYVVDAELESRLRHAPPGLRALVAHDVAEAGDPAAAVALLGEPSPEGASDYSVLAERCLRVAVLSLAGRTEQLREAVDTLAPYAGQVVSYGAVEHLGVVDYFVALGHRALGEPETARRWCDSAIDRLTAIANGPWLRRAERLAGHLRPGGPADGSTPLAS